MLPACPARRATPRALALLALAAGAMAPLSAQTLSPATRVARAASAAAYEAHLGFLASDLLEGRGSATRGGRLAAEYIATQFRRLGLEPAGDSGTFYHRVPIIAHTPEPTLRVTGAAPAVLRYRDDYVLWSMRNEPSDFRSTRCLRIRSAYPGTP